MTKVEIDVTVIIKFMLYGYFIEARVAAASGDCNFVIIIASASLLGYSYMEISFPLSPLLYIISMPRSMVHDTLQVLNKRTTV